MQSESIHIYSILSIRTIQIACWKTIGREVALIDFFMSSKLAIIVLRGCLLPQQWLNAMYRAGTFFNSTSRMSASEEPTLTTRVGSDDSDCFAHDSCLVLHSDICALMKLTDVASSVDLGYAPRIPRSGISRD